jgi:signal transduction histidine kinase
MSSVPRSGFRTQMSRAEHLATLGELATGLAHEIRNPLAGIAGVIEIISRDLPSTSPARAVVKDVRQEIAQINHILTDLELAMRQSNSNQTQAAKLLDISRDALRYKLKKFGLMHGEEEEATSQSSTDTSSAR